MYNPFSTILRIYFYNDPHMGYGDSGTFRYVKVTPEDFTVEIFNLNKKVGDPTRSEKIVNEHNEVIFDKVVNFITNATMKEASPEAAVNEMPQEENPAAAQPGAEQSELPGADQSAAPPKV